MTSSAFDKTASFRKTVRSTGAEGEVGSRLGERSSEADQRELGREFAHPAYAEEQQLEQKLHETEDKLETLQSKRSDKSAIILTPEQEKELKLKWGYVDLTTEELMLPADRLVLVDGTEVIGLILDRTPDSLILKRAGTTVIVPKNRISAASTTVPISAAVVGRR